MFCGKCGFTNADGAVICQNCGEALVAQQPAQQAGYQQNTYHPVNQMPVQQPVYVVPGQPIVPDGYSETVSVKEWLGSMALMLVPIVNIVMIFVWAFGDTKKSKSNFYKASLIYSAIVMVISIVVSILVVVLGISLGATLY